jgi:hypothetical protein
MAARTRSVERRLLRLKGSELVPAIWAWSSTTTEAPTRLASQVRISRIVIARFAAS